MLSNIPYFLRLTNGGREVAFVADVAPDGAVTAAEVVARGTAEMVLALAGAAGARLCGESHAIVVERHRPASPPCMCRLPGPLVVQFLGGPGGAGAIGMEPVGAAGAVARRAVDSKVRSHDPPAVCL